MHRFATRLFRQQRHLHAVGECEALRARVEIGGRRVEFLTGRGRGVAFVVLEQCNDVDCRRNRRAIRCGVGYEFADGYVRRLEIRQRDALRVGGSDLAILVPLQKEQTPVTGGNGLGDGDPE